MLKRYLGGKKGGKKGEKREKEENGEEKGGDGVEGGFGKTLHVYVPKVMVVGEGGKGGKEGGVEKSEKVKKHKSFGILSPKRERRGGKSKVKKGFNSFNLDQLEELGTNEREEEERGKGREGEGGREEEREREGKKKGDGEDILVGGGEGAVAGEMGGDREQVMKLFACFPMLKERWEEGLKEGGEGEGVEGRDPLGACLSELVVTSLEATELRNVVYDLFNVYVPVMLFQVNLYFVEYVLR